MVVEETDNPALTAARPCNESWSVVAERTSVHAVNSLRQVIEVVDDER
jgi:hypothetical protein